ncbi:hypothetical protein QQZ08_000885 [Neonectria magnoliae]|uniref:Cyanovirin-N domain-containing protein n=1 Tax=Neonectria magnoliae TaxID=2732573 RepID=A0ABR1IG97_9HYPO
MLLKAVLLAIATAAAAWPGRGGDLIGMYSRAFEGVDGQEYIMPYDPIFPAFRDQCDGMQILGEGRAGSLALSGFCLDANETRYLTELNLNWCLQNNDGQLEVAAKPFSLYFDQSCSNFRLYQTGPRTDNKRMFLAAGCINKVGNFTPTYVKFDDANETLSVKPVDGRFVCGGHQGTRVAVGDWGTSKDKYIPPQ